MPKIHFRPLAETDFPLLLQWLEAPHVKAWWDQEISWTLDLAKQKYSAYTKGYKLDQGIKKPMHAYVVLVDDVPIGYVQFYNAWDFARDEALDPKCLPQSLAALDMYIGELKFLKKGLAPIILQKFLLTEVKPLFAHCLVDPDVSNTAAIHAYEQAGFKMMAGPVQTICWMLVDLSDAIYLCFCRDSAQSGNPAAVIENFEGDDVAKQALAARLKLPVTVFIEEAEVPVLRFFYPDHESVLCLHGTLAAGRHLMKRRKVNAIVVKTAAGQVLEIMQQNDAVQVLMPEAKILPMDIDVMIMTKMLRIDANQIDPNFPMIAASLGSPKLLVPIKTSAMLNQLKPDFDAIKQWSMAHQINGLYVYSADTRAGIDFIARGFNPKGGCNEDAATGVAAGALISVLPKSEQKEFVIDQGDAMNAPSRIEVTLADGQVRIGGVVYESR